MVKSKPQAAASGPSGRSSAGGQDLNGLGGRWLRLADVVRFLGNEGVNEGVVRNLVTATQLMESPEDELPIIEPDLITLAEASARFDIALGTLKGWVRNRHLAVRRRVTFSAPGGGKLLVDAADVAYLKDNPPKTGRPKKRQPLPE